MFKIVRFPSRLKSFFRSLTTEFHWNHSEYFQWFVLLLSFGTGPRNVSSLYRHLDTRERTHRTRFNNFLAVCRWNPRQTLQRKAYELLALLKPQKGETIFLIIDDTKKTKRGRQMDGVGSLFDPVTKRHFKGHQYPAATLLFRGFLIPWAIDLYLKEEDAQELGRPFRTTIDMVAEMIEAFEPPPGVEVIVLFDAYYLCKGVASACQQKHFVWISTVKPNRNLFRNGRKLKAGRYIPGAYKRGRKSRFALSKAHGPTRYSYVDVGRFGVKGLGEIHLIVNKKGREPNVLGLATNDMRLTPRQMMTYYDKRFQIEVFFKETKQLLGLGQYQNGSYEAAVTHLHLVCFAHALLTHLAITRASAQGKRKIERAPGQTTQELQNELRRVVWEDLVDYLKERPNGTSVVKELRRLLVAA